MGKRPFAFQPNGFYHVYNRGFNKGQLFFDERDYGRFYNNILRYRDQYPNIKIPVYCFLPNHFHFLVHTLESFHEGELSGFMRKIQGAYAMYFNLKYGDKVKKGLKSPVFEGRFGAREVFGDEYLQNLTAYIENNAVVHGIVKHSEDWEFSSFDPQKSETVSMWEDDFDPTFS